MTDRDIRRMKRKALLDLCGSNGIAIEKGWNRPDMIAALIAHRNADNPLVQTPPPGDRALFDELTVEPEAVDLERNAEPESPKPGKGGFRPGAGRKPGVTLEQSRIDNLPTTANRSILYLVRAMSLILARAYRCDDLALADDECDRVAVAVTRSMDFHGFTIPQGAAVDIECAGVLFEVGAPRAVMISQIVRTKKHGASKADNDHGQDGIGQNESGSNPDTQDASMPLV